MAKLGSAKDFLALKRNVVVISTSSSVGVGFNALWMPFLPIFMNSILGFDDIVIGNLYTINAFAMAVSMILGGSLSDHLGRKITIILGRCIYVLAPILLLLSMRFGAELSVFAMGLLGAGLGLSGPATSALLTESVKAERRGTALMVATRVFPSIPPIVTALIGGVLIFQGEYELVFSLAILGPTLMFVIEVLGLKETLSQETRVLKKSPKPKLRVVDLFLLTLTVAYALDEMSSQAISWYVPLYVTSLGFTAFFVGIMYAVLGAVVAVSALIGGKITDSIGRYQAIIISWVGLIPVLLLFTITKDYYFLLITYAIWVSFDLIDMAAPVAWISDNTEQKNRASKIGFFQSTSRFVSVIGPTLGTLTLLLSPQGPFIMKIIVQIVALVMVLALVLRKRT